MATSPSERAPPSISSGQSPSGSRGRVGRRKPAARARHGGGHGRQLGSSPDQSLPRQKARAHVRDSHHKAEPGWGGAASGFSRGPYRVAPRRNGSLLSRAAAKAPRQRTAATWASSPRVIRGAPRDGTRRDRDGAYRIPVWPPRHSAFGRLRRFTCFDSSDASWPKAHGAAIATSSMHWRRTASCGRTSRTHSSTWRRSVTARRSRWWSIGWWVRRPLGKDG